ncbi:MAG: aminotransferase class I/II-fold pyridoxal phosphate-dependent enzyme [Firmicutes bacterium]|nr:aminotransferase class I/II-fold pyridoxal phosphate-dependent enzyme [Bacillota bacterium]
MKYDFTSIMDRRGKDAIAIDGLGAIPGFTPDAPKPGFDPIPMWVADMNFPTAPSIQEKIKARVEHPAYGYFFTPDEYYDSIINWQTKRNGVKGLEKKHIGYENGVLGGVISALNVMCSRGDKILVHSPTYIGFTMSLENNGYVLVHSPLKRDEEGVWRMDYDDMEKKLKDNNIHVALFCSPHNPTGRVWEREELEKAMALFEKYEVQIVSDEIWSDIILNGNKFIPTQSVNEYARQNTVAMYAPSKTFNLAGLIGSYHIIYNDRLRDRVLKESSLTHYNSINVLSMHALIGAYCTEGQEWVDELCEVLSGNVNFAYDYILKNYKGISLAKPQGTYMLYLDCAEYLKEKGMTTDQLLKAGWDVGVVWQDGRPFLYPDTIRMNLALPYSRVQEAFRRLDEYVLK